MARWLPSLLFLPTLVYGQAASTAGFTLDSITVEGARTLAATAIVQASGLKTGQRAGVADFDGGRERLLNSGYFKTVAYRYKPSPKGGYELAFEVSEIEILYPLRVDALPAATDEVVRFLKTVDPLFTGQMPGTRPAIDRAARQIEQLLESKKQAGAVGGKLVAAGPERFEVSFTPVRGLPVVSMVEFEGSSLISAIDLRNKMADVAFGQPYTESGFRLFLDNQIKAQYETKGHLNVTFPKITTQAAADVLGLDVKVTVDEGAEYKISAVTVVGISADESAKMLKTAKLPANILQVPANAELVKEAAVRIRDGLRHRGFLDAGVSTDWKRDDDKKTAGFFIHLEQGEEYRFGRLTVNGLDLTGEAAIRKIWSVKTGDSFPVEYPDFFLAQVKEQGLFDNLGDMKAATSVDRKTHNVDVTLDFRSRHTDVPRDAPVRRPI